MTVSVRDGGCKFPRDGKAFHVDNLVSVDEWGDAAVACAEWRAMVCPGVLVIRWRLGDTCLVGDTAQVLIHTWQCNEVKNVKAEYE
jgi:hypothetical protein